MKVIILAAGQGTRLYPLTSHKPKCMVEINGRSILLRQLEIMKSCNIQENDIYIVTGYKSEVIEEYLQNTNINIVKNNEFKTSNMVYSLMRLKKLFLNEKEIIVSYGDIVYSKEVLNKVINSKYDISVTCDDEWYNYWAERSENPLDDAETFMINNEGNLIEIGQKTTDIKRIQSQYIGLMKFKNKGVKQVLEICREAKDLLNQGKTFGRTKRNYNTMYMTDLLQGLIDKKVILKPIRINRGWFEIDCKRDLEIASEYIDLEKGAVYWLTGLSGAGKTTIGKKLYNKIKKHKKNVLLLDGDQLRTVLESEEYSYEERKKLSMKYSKICKMIADQGIDVIICTISMFDDIRDWNRQNIANYKEIYIKVTMKELMKRNQKNLYKNCENVVNIDIEFEEPKQSDLIIENNGEKRPDEIAKYIYNEICSK